MMPCIDLTGKHFGLLTVIRRASLPEAPRPKWLCECQCGNTSVAHGQSLRGGTTRSCGCLRKSTATTHGRSRTAEHKAWLAIKGRCTNPRNKSWPYYGGRGITMCQKWQESFEAFSNDVGEKPGPRHELDRIDTFGNYEPGNVRWITHKENCNNRRYHRLLTYQGETLNMSQWAARVGLKFETLYARVIIRGWDVESALTTPVGQKRCRRPV